MPNNLSNEESATLAYILERTHAVPRAKVAPHVHDRLLALRLIQSADGKVTITADGVLALNRRHLGSHTSAETRG